MAGPNISRPRLHPGFTPEMLVVADLLYAVDYSLVCLLNGIMVDRGLPEVNHVSDAIQQARSKFMLVTEGEALELSLDEFFAEIAGNSAQQCRQQWSTCVAWMRIRTSLALAPVSTLMDPMLQQLHMDVQQEPGYAEVRAAAIVMTKHLAKLRCVNL